MADWLNYIPPWVFIALVAHGIILGTVAYMILLERKVAAWVQDRVGPNRAGPAGLLQPMADGLKFFFKEDYRPAGVDRTLFTIAPAIMMGVIIISIAVIPWAGTYQGTETTDITGLTPAQIEAAIDEDLPLGVYPAGEPRIETVDGRTLATYPYRYPFQIARLNIGVLFIIAALSMAVYGVVLGGWASNNKYSFLGGLRATAQMISYEIPLGLSLLAVAILYGTLELGEIVEKQAHYWAGFIPAWNIFTQPVAFVMFLICIHAEANRAPFDLAEAEQELVGGYHTEYSSMRFALFFLAEYAGMITTSAILVALFLGGWHFPGLGGGVDPADPGVTDSAWVIALRCLVFFVKVMLVIFIFMWVRWSLPRFRFDQLMLLAWRAMVPLTLFLLLATAVVMWAFGPSGYDVIEIAGQRHALNISGWMALALLGMNVAVLLLMALVSKLLPPPPLTNRRLEIPGSRFGPSRQPSPAAPS